jgi:hypothetical protein
MAKQIHSCARDPITGLTSIEKHFVQLYDGGVTPRAQLCEIIGCVPETLSNLLRRPHVLEAIKNRSIEEKLAPLVADREELQVFWTQTLRDPCIPNKDRLKASELLGKTLALFIDRSENKTTVTFEEALMALDAQGKYDDL